LTSGKKFQTKTGFQDVSSRPLEALWTVGLFSALWNPLQFFCVQGKKKPIKRSAARFTKLCAAIAKTAKQRFLAAFCLNFAAYPQGSKTLLQYCFEQSLLNFSPRN
jgi:hypothetical protein